jgi:hypothetical protein
MPVIKDRNGKVTIMLYAPEQRAVVQIASLVNSLANQGQLRKGLAAELVGLQHRVHEDGTLELRPEGLEFADEGEEDST